VPFLRIFRDKRGYEYFSLVHTPLARRGKPRQRVLYWFRSPPNIKVGRSPFDEEVMRALEAQNPDVVFDWDALRNTPMPPPAVEHWRERRRVERAMRQIRAEDEADSGGSAGEAFAEPPSGEEVGETVAEEPPADQPAVEAVSHSNTVTSAPAARELEPRRRRRRRGRRRGDGPVDPALPVATSLDPASVADSSSTEGEFDEGVGDDGNDQDAD
jgi:hypothetical protein